MQLAFVLYKYFPFGGLQRDFMRIALECQARGHAIRVYTPIWEGENPGGFDVRVAPVRAQAQVRVPSEPLASRTTASAWRTRIISSSLFPAPAVSPSRCRESTVTSRVQQRTAHLPV